MFWYPSGPIFKSNFQNGTKNKSKKNVFIVTMLLVELELIKTFEIDKDKKCAVRPSTLKINALLNSWSA